jgi:cold shock CspA family protein/ribosome-associated translation inhibitor RaiA
MEIAVRLDGNAVELTPDQRSLIRREIDKLERFFSRLVACRVVVSVPHRRPGGDPVAWTVRLALTVPGAVLEVSRQAQPSFREALDDSFDAARRRLEDYARELRGNVKFHAVGTCGRVTRLNLGEGYGFISTEVGDELYFHRNSVPDGGFDRLVVGSAVRYVESEGEQGPQASLIVPLWRHAPAVSGREG